MPRSPSLDSATPMLIASASALRGADQVVIATVPLVAAAVFGAGPDLVGKLVAVQSAAWLLVSLPAGVMVDRHAPRRVLGIAHLGLCLALLVGAAAIAVGSLALFAAAAFFATGAVVTGLLAEGALVQGVVPAGELGRVNGRLQVAQSLATIAAPLLVGALVAAGSPVTALLLAGAGALAAIGATLRLDGPPARTAERDVVWEVRESVAFVADEPHLRGIVACALFWNTAFFALIAVVVPWAISQLKLGGAEIGIAQSGLGVGALLASLLAARVLAVFAPRSILFFGPASSVVAILVLMFAAPTLGTPALFLSYALLGFGPILWFVTQVTIRQLVTPRGLIGRVAAVVQVAIYGVRAIGAMIGGQVAATAGYDAALLVVLALFVASTCVIPLSALGRLRRLPAAG